MIIDMMKMRDLFLMRASHVCISRTNVQQAVKEVISEQKYVNAPHVDTYIVL